MGDARNQRQVGKRLVDRLGLASIVLVSLILASCGGGGSGGGSGGGGGPVDTDLTAQGIAQKGLFQVLNVEASAVDASGNLGAAVPVTVTDQSFSLDIAHNQLTLFEATGTFTSEITGDPIIADRPLKLIIAPGTTDLNANINIATTLVAELVQRDLRAGGGNAAALIQQHTDFINTVLGFPAGTDPTQLDFNNIAETSDMSDANLALLILGGGIIEMLTSDQLYAGGFQDIVDGILAAQNVEEAIAVLSVLNGLSAEVIYALAQQYSGINLPTLLIGNRFFVWVCDGNVCQWIEVTDPMVSVAGTSAWEADGKARVTVRLNRASIQDVNVTLEAGSLTATAGEDFVGVRRLVSIAAGVTTVPVELDLIIDADAEPTEEFSVSIESQTESYPVFQREAEVTLYDGVKATADNPQNRDATGLQLTIDVASVCNPVQNMGATDCLPLDGTESLLGIVDGRANVAKTEIDVIGDCTALGKCGVDWIVDFFLVAKDNVGTTGEVPLGAFLYPSHRVHLATEMISLPMPLIRLTDANTLALASEAATQNWDLELEARIGSTNTVAAGEPIPPLMVVPDSVLVGETLLNIGVVYDVMPGADYGCAAAQYAINAQYAQQGADANMGSGTLCVDFDPGGAMAGPAVMVEGRLDLFGGMADPGASAQVILPDGLFGRVSLTGGGVTLVVTPPALLLFAPNPAVAASSDLHSEGWPFEFRINALSLTPAGVELGYNNMRYVMDAGYSSQDPRSLGILYSNDIYYRGVAGQSGALILGSTGVNGDITVTGGPFHADHTAFPRARVEWQDFSQAIDDNVLQPIDITVDEYRLGQNSSCSGLECAAGQKDWYSVAGTVALDGKGYVVGNAINTGAHMEPRWGARESGNHAWSRPDDLMTQSSVNLAVPGYIIPGERVGDVLIGHFKDPDIPGDAEIHALGTTAFIDGNHYPTGISIGPEFYRDGGVLSQGDGQMLTGNALRLDNGVDPSADLQSSPGVKYVIRNAGITGVFNIVGASLGSTAPQFYGYDIDLDRFAVRMVDNELDTFNWVDGHLALEGEAGGAPGVGEGFDIFFTNLEIDCSARLGNIDLLYEACDGQDNNGNLYEDENCSPKLHAWQAKTDIFAAGFTGNDPGQACVVAPQQFGMQHQLHFLALNKPVAFDSVWDTNGDLFSHESGQLSSYRFDRSEEGDGFPVKTSSASAGDVILGAAAVDGEDYGWLEFKNTAVGVPFWNALETDMRFANAPRFGEISAEPTVVLKKGQLQNQTAAQRNKDVLKGGNADSEGNNDLGIKARYEWGRTGFGFRLPVYYQPWQLDNGRSDDDAQGRQSRFLGRQLTKDLFVLDANAGINFIEPDRTKLSFGASADFTRLEGLEFQIDISDADSAAAVDKVLQDLRIIRGPLFEPAVTDLLDTLNIVNRFASRGLDELLQQALEEAVEEIGKATAPLTPNNQDPFVTASEVLTQLQSMPQQVVALIENDIERPINNELASLKNKLRTALIDLETAIDSIDGSEPLVDRLERTGKFAIIDNATQKVRDILDQVESIVRRVDIQLQANLDLIEDVILWSIIATRELGDAVQNVNLVMRQATAIVDSACNGGLLIDEEGSGFLSAAAHRVAAIRRVADIIQYSDSWLAAAETIAQSDDVKRRLATARQRIKDATGEVIAFVDDADDVVSSLLCHPEELEFVVEKAEEFTQRITDALPGMQQPLLTILAELQKAQTLKTTIADHIYTPIRTVRAALEPAEDGTRDGNGDRINRIISCILYNASHGEDDDSCSVIVSSPLPDAVAPYGINALANNGGNERDIADALFYVVETEIADLFKTIKTTVATAASGVVPGAYMSPEELRRTLVTEIMRSEPVKRLRSKMDEHFAEVAYAINNIGLQIIDQVNLVIEDALSTVTGPINDALKEATAVVRAIPLQSAGITGFATIAGNELERAHVSAGWTMRGKDDDDATGFKAALDAESWSAKHTNPDVNTPTACVLGPEEALLDVKISAYGLPINVMAADINIEKLYLGFTLEQNTGSGPALKPVGVFGGINTIGEIGFSEAVVFDPAFAAGLGTKQTYIGASAGAVFSSLTADVAFLVGRVCPGNTVLTDLDPSVEKFLPNLPASGFTGAYLRGGATIPIIPGGCALNIGVVADFGTWIFVGRPTVFGGLVGGGATGQVACIASLKGKVTVGGSASTDGDLKLAGEAWGVAGLGPGCNPGTWTSVPRSRDDNWCGTGDAQMGASFENGKWKVNPPKPSAIH